MIIKINDTELPVYPSEFSVTVMDLDNSESTVRTADGGLNRDRIATKRKIDMTWPALTWTQVSTLLQSMSDVFFEVYFPDPMSGQYDTKTFYVSDRPVPVVIPKDGDILWGNVKVTLIER